MADISPLALLPANGGGIVGTNAQSFGASGARSLNQTTTSGTTAVGTSLVVNSATGIVVNNKVWLIGAGAAGALYTGTVAAINSNTLTLSGATSTGVANGTFVQIGGPITTTTSGTTNSGSQLVTVASSYSFAPGQGILISGAGASSADYIGTITSVANNVLGISPATGTTVNTGTNVQHDESAAINAALTSLSVTGGTLVFPDGHYLCNGALLDPGGANAILPLPKVPYFTSVAQYPGLPIQICGITPPSPSDGYVPSSPGNITRLNGAIIQTAATTGNLIGGYDAASGIGTFTNVTLSLKNLVVRGPDGPGIVAVNATNVAGLIIDSVTVDTDVSGFASAPGTGTTAGTSCTAIAAPGLSNNGNFTCKNLNVLGWNIGTSTAEHCQILSANFWSCRYPILVEQTNYPLELGMITCSGCVHGIYTTASSATPIKVENFNTEHQSTPAWATNADDVNDANNALTGEIWFAGQNLNPVIVGGGNLVVHSLAVPNSAAQNQPPLAGIPGWTQGTFANLSLRKPSMTVNQIGQSVIITSPITTVGENDLFTGYYAAIPQAAGNFTGMSFSCRFTANFTSQAAQSSNGSQWFEIGVGNSPSGSTSNMFRLRWNSAATPVLAAYNVNTQKGTNQNTTTQIYLMVYESSGTIGFKYSTTGAAGSWTVGNLGTDSTPSWVGSSVASVFLEGFIQGDGNADGFCTFDQFAYLPYSSR